MPTQTLASPLPVAGQKRPDPAQAPRLLADLKAFERERGAQLRAVSLWIGGLQKRFSDNPIGRWVLRHVTTRMLAWAIVRFRFFGIKPGKNALDVAYEWLKLATFFGAPYEIESATPQEVVVLHPECTMGFQPFRHERLCRASMTLDHEIVRRLGGRFTIKAAISSGAIRCRHVIEWRGTPS